MKHCIICAILILSLPACRSKTDGTGELPDRIPDTTEEKQQENLPAKAEPEDRNFMVFFDEFMFDEAFQKSRIRFPVFKDGQRIDSPEEWVHLGFYRNRSFIQILCYDTLTVNDYTWDPDTLTLIIASLTLGITKEFRFEWMHSGWTLTGIESSTADKVADQEFLSFLEQFYLDSAYQRSHIQFPLPYYYSDPGIMYEIVYDSLTSEGWEHVPFSEKYDELMILDPGMTRNNFRNIYYRGVENGIEVQYHFRKTGEQWTLVKIEDYST